MLTRIVIFFVENYHVLRKIPFQAQKQVINLELTHSAVGTGESTAQLLVSPASKNVRLASRQVSTVSRQVNTASRQVSPASRQVSRTPEPACLASGLWIAKKGLSSLGKSALKHAFLTVSQSCGQVSAVLGQVIVALGKVSVALGQVSVALGQASVAFGQVNGA